ncbi:hypothetical protein [Fibrella aestuarina]|nr:hypothetical protein [Fibrella aestuarina]
METHTLQVGVAVGVTQLFGDLSSPDLKPAVGVTLTYPISRTFGFQLLGDLGTLGAQQQAFYNTQAQTRFTQASIGASVNLSELINRKTRQQRPEQARNHLSVYLTYGLIFFNATAYSLSDGSVQRLTNGPGSHRTASDNYTAKGVAGVTQTHEVVVPLGLRYCAPLSRSLSLTVDLRYNVVHTDKLDATFDHDNSTIKTLNGGDIFGPIPSGNSLDAWGALSVGLAYRLQK